MSSPPGPLFDPLDGAAYYHWPTVDTTSDWDDADLDDAERCELRDRIESFFADRLGAPALLVPSARAGLALLLSHHGIQRGDDVFAPRWSAHCLWDVISRTATPRSRLDDDVDVALAVHQWGQIHDAPADIDALVVEDSVDSLLTDGRTLFPNSGRYELLSLPKLVGSYTGGIILFREAADARAVRTTRSPDRSLGRRQSRLRHSETRGEDTGHKRWGDREHENQWLDGNALRNIEACLPYYEYNADTIRDRLAQLDERDLPSAELDVRDSRLPPVAPFPTDRESVSEPVTCRHLNVARDLADPVYERTALVPLHFGVTESFFERTLSLVCDAGHM